MTNKQRAFALEYMVDMNATQAAIRAGYSPKTAKQQGHMKGERSWADKFPALYRLTNYPPWASRTA